MNKLFFVLFLVLSSGFTNFTYSQTYNTSLDTSIYTIKEGEVHRYFLYAYINKSDITVTKLESILQYLKSRSSIISRVYLESNSDAGIRYFFNNNNIDIYEVGESFLNKYLLIRIRISDEQNVQTFHDEGWDDTLFTLLEYSPIARPN